MSESYVEYQIDALVVMRMVVLGLARKTADGKAHELTEKGNEWLRDYCTAKLEKAA